MSCGIDNRPDDDRAIHDAAIRDAAAGDLAAIKALYGQLAPHVANVDRDLPAVLNDPNAICLILEREGRAAGMVLGYVRTSLSSGKKLVIDELVVDHDQRGRGYGRALLEHCIKTARERGLDNVELACSLSDTELHRFYTSMGFEHCMRLYSLFLGEEGSDQEVPTVEELRQRLRTFAQEREWQQYHTPKNLAMALSVEVAEIVEVFQWLTAEQSMQLDQETQARLEEEIGDVMLYLTNLADKLGIDPLQAARKKIELNENKYPAELVRGKAKKYTEYEEGTERSTAENAEHAENCKRIRKNTWRPQRSLR